MSEQPLDPEACPPCRGTGRVISGADDKRHEVTCPWCEGNGRRAPLPTTEQSN